MLSGEIGRREGWSKSVRSSTGLEEEEEGYAILKARSGNFSGDGSG